MDHLDLFRDDQLIAGLAEATVYEYMRTVRKVEGFEERPTLDAARSYLAERRKTVGAATLLCNARALKRYSRWYATEFEEADALARLPYPKAPIAAPGRIADPEAVAKLLHAHSGPSFEHRRVRAVVVLLRDSGMRRSELARLNVADVDFERGRITVHESKNLTGRHVPLSAAVRGALKRWLLVRAQHNQAGDAALFIGRDGRLRPDSVTKVIDAAAQRAGVEITSHMFRRGLAHRWVQAGGADDLLMHVAGWRDTRMPARYRAEARAELAIEAYGRIIG